MSSGNLTGRLRNFSGWKRHQLEVMKRLEGWLKKEGLYTSEAQHALEHACLTLGRDHITVAVVGEFSRGKTELINALFFSNHDFRLLPTDAGRTTMCPTEIFQDPDTPPYLRLLPIETRLQEISLADLQKMPDAWEHVPLDIDDSEQLQLALLRIREQKLVPREIAARMGLETEAGREPLVPVPAWRLAHFNYRHPLLAEGLHILDTPGLNAVSSEPELTYEMLPGAQARLFVVGADTGITQSDMEIWQQFIRQPGATRQRSGVMVVLNKADTLWDELRPEHEIRHVLERQRREVAELLGIPPEQVHAVSAQKGLLARIRKDAALEQRSGIAELERHLAHALVDNRRRVIVEQSTELVAAALENIGNLVSSRQERLKKQIQTLHDLTTQGEEAIDRLLRQTQKNKERYQASLGAYKQARSDFTTRGRILLEAIAPDHIERIIRKAHAQMTGAWTTVGLKESMRQLFEAVNRQMEIAGNQSQEMRRLIRTIYRRFRNEHDMRLAEPAMLSLITHQVNLNLVYQESEIFRKSPRTTLTEQHFAVKRYFQSIVSRVRKIFREAHGEARQWMETVLEPLTSEINEHRRVLAEQLADLKLSGQARSKVRQRLALLVRDSRKLEQQLQTLHKLRRSLLQPVPPAGEEKG